MTLAEINIEVDVGALAAPPADPADRLVRGADAGRAPDLVPHLRHRAPGLVHRRRHRRRLGRAAPGYRRAHVPGRRLQRPGHHGRRDRVRLHCPARREGPVRTARPPAADPAPGPPGQAHRRAAAALSRGADHRCAATGSCTGGSRPRPGSRTRSSARACGTRSRSVAGCSSSSVRSPRPAATCSRRP